MLIAVNMSRYVTSRGAYYSAVLSMAVLDKVIYVLDTDDLVIQSIKCKKLLHLIESNKVSIENLVVENGMLKVSPTFLDMRSSNDEVVSLDGLVKYRGDVKSNVYKYVDFPGKDLITINGKEFVMGFCNGHGDLLSGESYLEFYINWDKVFSIESRIHMPRMSGIPYYYVVNNYLVIQYMLVDLYCHTVSVVLSLSGELIDVFSSDMLFAEIDYHSKDKKFRTKYLTANGGRY